MASQHSYLNWKEKVRLFLTENESDFAGNEDWLAFAIRLAFQAVYNLNELNQQLQGYEKNKFKV